MAYLKYADRKSSPVKQREKPPGIKPGVRMVATAMPTKLFLAASLIAGCSSVSIAESAVNSDKALFSIQAAYLGQQTTDIENGGSFSLDSSYLQVGVRKRVDSRFSIGLSIGGGRDDYRFDGLNGDEPWSNIRNMRLAIPVSYDTGNAWRFIVSPSVRYDYEEGASSSDGQTWGLLGAAIYKVSDSLSIGPGIGVFSQLDDDTSVIPILAIDWKILPNLSLETGRGFAASRGPGLQLNWRQSSQLTLSSGARYEKQQFRLKGGGLASNGVGEDKSVPLYLSADYKVKRNLSVGALVGAKVGGSLAADDSDGGEISRSDYDTAPLWALTFKLRL